MCGVFYGMRNKMMTFTPIIKKWGINVQEVRGSPFKKWGYHRPRDRLDVVERDVRSYVRVCVCDVCAFAARLDGHRRSKFRSFEGIPTGIQVRSTASNASA